jgi:hypothetical protein
MQDRIKQNLFQTESTLHKLSASFDDDVEPNWMIRQMILMTYLG